MKKTAAVKVKLPKFVSEQCPHCDTPIPGFVLNPINKLNSDLNEASLTLSSDEARFLVDAYYAIQEQRKASANQLRSLVESGEPHKVINWFLDQNANLENQVKRALDTWSDSNPVGVWAKSLTGIGPVISAGLLANIDITKAPSVGHIWRFAGLDPTVTWEKGKKRPWNASLKTLCWKIGESFVKFSNHKDDYYGRLYVKRKEFEEGRNSSGELADQAKAKLEKFKIGKATDAYKAYSTGILPPAHIHARAKRWTVKLFLAHYHHVAYHNQYGVDPPKPFVLEHMGHVDFIPPPNWR